MVKKVLEIDPQKDGGFFFKRKFLFNEHYPFHYTKQIANIKE